MSKILVDELVNLVGTDKVTFSEGLKISNGETIDLNGATITLNTGIGLNDQLLASTGSGLKWVTFSDTNSTYAFASVNAAVNDVKLKLTGGGEAAGQLNQVTMTGSGSVSLTENAGVITVTGVDTNTTYDLTFADETDGASATLTGSDSSADALILRGGSNIDVTRSNNIITFSTTLSGTVGAPSTTTDNAVALFDGTNGTLLKNSTLVYASNGDLSGVNDITVNSITAASQTSNKIPFWYDNISSFPSATAYEGSFAYSDANATMHYAAGNSWYQVAKLSDIQQDTDTTYSIDFGSTTFGIGTTTVRLTLLDSNAITDTVDFVARNGAFLFSDNQKLYFDGKLYSVSAETNNNSQVVLRLHGENRDNTNSPVYDTDDDIVFAGADGLTVERTDENTITFRQGGGSGGSAYTDASAKDAAAQALINGTSLGISFTYDSVNKVINSQVGTTPTTFNFTLAAETGNYLVTGSDRGNTFSGDADPTITVYEGDTIQFSNGVNASHPLYIRVSDGGASVSSPAASGEGTTTVTWTPTTAGTYYYQCGNHSSMIGPITVLSAGGGGGGSTTSIITPVAYAVVSANTAGTGTGMSWGAYDTGTYEIDFTFDTAQPDTNYYVHTNREHYATHNIEVYSKTTTGFTTKWTNSDGSDLAPSIFGGVLIVYSSTPTKTVGGGGGGGSAILYDLYGTNTTSNNLILNLDPSVGNTDQLEFVGADATTITWDSTNNRATIASPAQVQPDWSATSGLGEILNKPTIPTAYTLPAATTSTLGGVSIGAGLGLQPSGEIATSLQIVTDASNTTTNDLSAAGLALNTNYTSVTGATGDIKRINDLPHYHDGTDWRPFYLTGTAQQAASSDVNFDDVQVRMDFGGTVAYNHANQLTAKINNNSTGDVGVVTSPVKYGTHALKIFNEVSGAYSDCVFWAAEDNSARSSIWGDGVNNRHFWWNAKRGGCLDWSQDWTIEFWVRFDDLTGASPKGLFHVYNYDDIGSGSFGLVLDENGSSSTFGWGLCWFNYRNGATTNIQLEPLNLNNYSEDTWYFISLTFDASTGEFVLHRDGVNTSAGVSITPTDTNLIAADGSDGDQWETVLGSFRSQNGASLVAEYRNNMYLDDIRFTQFARYDSNNYTAPTDTLPITADAPPTVDPDWSNVIIRNTFDTNINDISQYAASPSSNSDASIQTTNVKYGAGALRMSSVLGYIEHYSNNPPFDPSGTFTTEFWINWDSITAGNGVGYVFNTVWSQSSVSTSDDVAFGLAYTSNAYSYLGATGDGYRFFWRNGSTVSYLHSDNIPSAIILGNYNHVALVRDANGDMRVYFNGYKLRFDTLDTTVFSDTQVTYDAAGDFRIGTAQDDFSVGQIEDFGFYGYIDDFRITNDVKYTDNFTPPSGPLPTTGTVTSDPGTPTSSVTGLATRADLTGSVTLNDNATGNLNITGYKAYSLLKIETDADAWVRVYTDDAARTADAFRSEGADPLPGDGVIAETRGSGAIQLSPPPYGYNNDFPNVGDTIYTSVTNRSGSSATINVTLTAIRLEA